MIQKGMKAYKDVYKRQVLFSASHLVRQTSQAVRQAPTCLYDRQLYQIRNPLRAFQT